MSRTERILGLIGFALAIVGAILLLQDGVNFSPSLEGVLNALPPLILGVMAVIGAFLQVTKRHLEGGLLCVIAGIVALVLGLGVVPAVVVLLGGVLGLVAKAT